MSDLERAKEILKVYQEKERKTDNHNKDKEPLEEVYNYIADAFKTIEICDIIDTRADIEYYIEHSSSRRQTHHERRNAIYHIYATLIGIIDCRNDWNIKNKKRYESFNGSAIEPYYKKEIEEIEKDIENLNNYREQLLEDYYLVFSKYNNSFDIVVESFKENPSHKYFGKLCSEIAENCEYHQSPEFMGDYLFGYKKSMYFFPEEIIEKYQELFDKYNIFETENENNKRLVKSLLHIKEEQYTSPYYTEDWA